MRQKRSAIERWSGKVEQLGPCIRWKGATSGWGYPQMRDDDGRVVYVHKWVYERAHGPVPVGHVVDHTCENRWCVRETHLEAVTPAENRRRETHRVARPVA